MSVRADVPSEVEKRGTGFTSACERLHIQYEKIILRDTDADNLFFSFLQDHIHNGKLDYDGIFCNTDSLALRVIRFLGEQNVRVPQNVQIIGYDGLREYATGRYPCSTIVQPISQMAETAVRLLLFADDSLSPGNVCLPVHYAYGGTTKE